MYKCKVCGNNVSISRDGWLTESYQNGKKEVRITNWYHVIGHWHGNKFCKGSGATPVLKGVSA